jgi:nucleotide-binding universal stress UspA family protein
MAVEPIRSILVTTDLSPPADQALARAARLARERGASLTALSVIDRVIGGDAPPENILKLLFGEGGEVVPALKRRAEEALRGKLATIAPQAGVVLRAGPAFLEIIRQAREQAADLIVLGAHGGHFLRKWVLGTTAERVVRKGDRPVLVVKKAPRAPYRRLLAAVDFSDTARHALAFALRVAPGARLTLLHVYDLSQMAAPAIDLMTDKEFLRLQRGYEEEQRARLERLAGGLGLDPGKVTCLVRYGYPGRVVNAVLSEARSDLAVIGTRGLSGLRHLLLGSVAEHVLREAGCDVLVAPPPTIDFALP